MGLVILLRQLERWLHQHIFKVGWLLTRNYETTTILYYTFFLPGVILHEIVYWLMAGVLNVRADRAIQWPEKQEIGELNLNFVNLSRRAGRTKRAIISAAPLITGMIVAWVISINIFNIDAVMQTMSTGELEDVVAGIRQLISAPDFWLWFYLVFVVSNTMFPTVSKDLRGWWTVAAVVTVVIIALFVIGVGNQILSNAVAPISEFLNVLIGTLLLIISINVFMTAVLGAIESAIERVTGYSATFKNGKMITMTREELIEQRQQERRRAIQSRRRQTEKVSGPPSIYAFPLPVPGAPGREPVSQAASAVLGMGEETDSLPDRPSIRGLPAGTVSADQGDNASRRSIPSKTQTGTLPDQRPAAKQLPSSIPLPDRDVPDESKPKQPGQRKPAFPLKQATASSRAGVTSFGKSDQSGAQDKPSSRSSSLGSSGKPSQRSSQPPSQFGSKPFGKSDSEDDDLRSAFVRSDDDSRKLPRNVPSFGSKPAAKSGEDEAHDEGKRLPQKQAPTSRFGAGSFGKGDEDDDADTDALRAKLLDTDDDEPKPSRATSRFGASAFGGPSTKKLATSDADRSFSSFFKSGADESDDDDNDESIGFSLKPAKPAGTTRKPTAPGSLQSSIRPAPKFTGTTGSKASGDTSEDEDDVRNWFGDSEGNEFDYEDDDEYEDYDDDDEFIYDDDDDSL